MLAVAVAVAVVVVAQPGPPPAPTAPAAPAPATKPVAPAPDPKARIVVVDDRATKDQAPAAFIDKTVSELQRRRGLRVERMSALRRTLDPRADQALSACGDDAGCLATATREMGGDVVVMVRLTRREGALFVAVTRVNALRPQITDDEATLAGNEADALAAVSESIADLFAETELISP